jgi:predicted ATP-dependent endonuclease of OLD family
MYPNMDNKMNTSNIKSFAVYGFWGTDDVYIPFNENIKILVGENGIGKTQILNLFYYTLTRNFFKLGEFKFDRLVLAVYRLINIHREYDKYKKAFFIDRDFNEPLAPHNLNIYLMQVIK